MRAHAFFCDGSGFPRVLRNFYHCWVIRESASTSGLSRRWWDHMRDVMATNPDGSPVSEDLREVFYLK